MLVINLINKDVKRKRKRFFSKKKEPEQESPVRSSFVCKNIVFNIVNLSSEQILSGKLDRLFARFKGKIIKTSDDNVNEYLKDNLYDTSLYLKKAYLSQLKIILKRECLSSICIYDNNLKCNDELILLAKICKNVTVYSPLTPELQRFSDYCFLNYGITVLINESFALNRETVYVNFNDISGGKDVYISIKGEERLLVPDIAYYLPNENTALLTSYGVPLKTACALLKDKST